jgi:hypothetical protein
LYDENTGWQSSFLSEYAVQFLNISIHYHHRSSRIIDRPLFGLYKYQPEIRKFVNPSLTGKMQKHLYIFSLWFKITRTRFPQMPQLVIGFVILIALLLLILGARWGIDWATLQANWHSDTAEQVLFLVVILLFLSTLGFDLVIGKTHIHSDCLLKLAYLPVSRMRFNACVILISFMDLWSLVLLTIFGGLFLFFVPKLLFAFFLAPGMVLFLRAGALFGETLLIEIYNRIPRFYLYMSMILLFILVKSGLCGSWYRHFLQDTFQFMIVHAQKTVMAFFDNPSTGVFAGHFMVLIFSSVLFILVSTVFRGHICHILSKRPGRFFSLLLSYRMYRSSFSTFILFLTKELQFMLRCRRFTWMVPILLIIFMLPLDYYRQGHFLTHAQLFLLFTMPFSIDMGFLFFAEGRVFANYCFLPVSMNTVVWAKQGAYMIFFYGVLMLMTILFQWLVLPLPLSKILMIMVLMTAFFVSSLAWQNLFLSGDFKHIDFTALFEKTWSGSVVMIGLFLLLAVCMAVAITFEFSGRLGVVVGCCWLILAVIGYVFSVRHCTRQLRTKFSHCLSIERG